MYDRHLFKLWWIRYFSIFHGVGMSLGYGQPTPCLLRPAWLPSRPRITGGWCRSEPMQDPAQSSAVDQEGNHGPLYDAHSENVIVNAPLASWN